MFEFKDKIVVITGSANGLGKALATEFYRQGCHLALIDVDAFGLENVKNELECKTQKITVHPADVSNEKDLIRARQEILDLHSSIDILVNNAGISISQNFEEMDLHDFKHVFDINFWGTILCAKTFLKDLKTRPYSFIVNIVSNFALMGFPGKTAYGSSKSAVLGFTNALKTELHNTSVNVSLVIPPILNTGLVKNGKHMDERKKKIEASYLEKNGMPLDKAARIIVRQIQRKTYRIRVGPMMFYMDTLVRLFPSTVHRFIGKNKGRIEFI